jgi:general secretion pathway protein I
MRPAAGFTLIEVLIALAIVAIALAAALRAAAVGTAQVEEDRARLLGGWVAENLLAEHHARSDWLPTGVRQGSARQGTREFRWREEITAMPNPAFRRIDIFVFAPDDARVIARLTGFLLQPVRTAR